MPGTSDNNQAAVDLAKLVKDALYSFLTNSFVPPDIAHRVSGTVASYVGTAGVLVTFLFSAIFRGAAEVVALFLEAMDDVRNQNQDVLNNVTAAAISDILGIEVSGADMPKRGGGDNNIAVARAIGTKLLDALTKVMGGQVSDQPGPGETAARGFLGFGMNFAVNAGLWSLLGELASLGQIKDFKEIPEDLLKAMSLQRLMRLGLQPVVQAKITKPYTREVNAMYRPNQLAVGEYVLAFHSGRMDEATVRKHLAELGFADPLIDELLNQHLTRFSAREVDALVRYGDLDEQRGLELLAQDGMGAGIARTKLLALARERQDAQERAYADEILSLAKERMIDEPTFSTMLQRLHISTDEQQGLLNRLGVWLENHHKALTIAELIFLFERQLITEDRVTAWAEQQGYSSDDQLAIDLFATAKDLDFEAAHKAKAAKAAAAAGKKKASPLPAK